MESKQKRVPKNLKIIKNRLNQLGEDALVESHNDQDQNLMKYSLHPESNLGVNATSLISGTTCRSCQYICIFCSKPVFFVSNQKTPYFRHENDQSCLKGLNQEEIAIRKQIYESIRTNEENKNCKFHQNWQSHFDPKHLEKRISKNNKTHVADIFITCPTNESIILKDNDHNSLISNLKSKLVIEIQHSYINTYDAINRQDFYAENDQDLLWIFDISNIHHRIEKVKTLSSSYIRIVFPKTQLKGVSSLIENKKDKANILLDNNGPYLFHINNIVSCDVDTLKVSLIHRNDLLKQLQKYCNIQSLFEIKEQNILYDYENNYHDVLQKLPNNYQHDMDEIVNIIEDISYSELIMFFKNLRADFDTFQTTIEMITSWISIIRFYFLPNEIVQHVFDTFYEWVKHVRKHQLYYIDDKNFDGIQSEKSIGLSEEIKSSEYLNVCKIFQNNNKIKHLTTIRRIYEIKYDQTHRKEKIDPFRSAKEDGVNYYNYNIDTLIFDDIDMHNIKFDIFHLNEFTPIFSKKWLIENAFLTSDLPICKTYVQKLKEEREKKKQIYENLKEKMLSKKRT